MTSLTKNQSDSYYFITQLVSFGFAYAAYYFLGWAGLAAWIYAGLSSEFDIWRREVMNK